MFPSSFLDLKNYLLKNIYSPENKSDALSGLKWIPNRSEIEPVFERFGGNLFF